MVAMLIRKTAKELAGAFYDGQDALNDGRVGRTDKFRAFDFGHQPFVNEYWPDFVPMARKLLAHMLTEPGRAQSEKDQIYDALLRDQRVRTDEDMIAPSIMRMN